MISPEAELPDNGVEPCTDLSDEIERILRPARTPGGWIGDLSGSTCCGGLGCSGLGRELSNPCRECGGGWRFVKNRVSWALKCEPMGRMPRPGGWMRHRWWRIGKGPRGCSRRVSLMCRIPNLLTGLGYAWDARTLADPGRCGRRVCLERRGLMRRRKPAKGHALVR